MSMIPKTLGEILCGLMRQKWNLFGHCVIPGMRPTKNFMKHHTNNYHEGPPTYILSTEINSSWRSWTRQKLYHFIRREPSAYQTWHQVLAELIRQSSVQKVEMVRNLLMCIMWKLHSYSDVNISFKPSGFCICKRHE